MKKVWIIILILNIFAFLSLTSCKQENFIEIMERNNPQEIESALKDNPYKYLALSYEKNPLVIAAENDSFEIVTLLIDYGFDPNMTLESKPILQYSLEQSYYNSAAALLIAGASYEDFPHLIKRQVYIDKNEVVIDSLIQRPELFELTVRSKLPSIGDEGNIPFPLWLIKENYDEKVFRLFNTRIGENYTDSEMNDAMHYAATFGSQDVLHFLIDNNYDINSLNSKHETPVMTASRFRNYNHISVLLNNDCDIHVTADNNDNLLNRLILDADLSHTESILPLIQELIDRGININNVGEGNGWDIFGTPLMMATAKFNEPVAKLLIDNEANPFVQHFIPIEEDEYHHIPEIYIIEADVFDIIEYCEKDRYTSIKELETLEIINNDLLSTLPEDYEKKRIEAKNSPDFRVYDPSLTISKKSTLIVYLNEMIELKSDPDSNWNVLVGHYIPRNFDISSSFTGNRGGALLYDNGRIEDIVYSVSYFNYQDNFFAIIEEKLNNQYSIITDALIIMDYLPESRFMLERGIVNNQEYKNLLILHNDPRDKATINQIQQIYSFDYENGLFIKLIFESTEIENEAFYI